MVLDADTFFRAMQFVVDMQWGADTAPRDGEQEDVALRLFVQKHRRLRKLLPRSDWLSTRGAAEEGLLPLTRSALCYHLSLAQRADSAELPRDRMLPNPTFADEYLDAPYGQRIVSIRLQKLYRCLTPVCHGLLSLAPFAQLRTHLRRDVRRRMQANQSFSARYLVTDNIVGIIAQPAWFISLVWQLLGVRYEVAVELVCGAFSQKLRRCFHNQGLRGPLMNSTSFAAAWVPVLLGTTTGRLRQYLFHEHNIHNVSSLQLDSREVARLSRQLPSKGPVTYFLFARLLYCHCYALVSTYDTFWDRTSQEWLGKQTIAVVDTFLAHAAELLCSPCPLARALASHHPDKQVSCRSLTTEVLDVPSRGVRFTSRGVSSIHRACWHRVLHHIHWIPVGENAVYSALLVWLLLDFERGPDLPRHCELWCTLPAPGSLSVLKNVSNQASFKAVFADPSRLVGAVFMHRYGWNPEPVPRGTAATWSSAPSPVSSRAYSPSSSRNSSRSPSPTIHRSNSPAAAARSPAAPSVPSGSCSNFPTSAPSPVSSPAYSPSSSRDSSRSPSPTVHRSSDHDNPAAPLFPPSAPSLAAPAVSSPAAPSFPAPSVSPSASSGSCPSFPASDVCEPCGGCSMDMPNASRCSYHPWICQNVPPSTSRPASPSVESPSGLAPASPSDSGTSKRQRRT